ncbi:MAG: methyltransferase domain-containing protein [Acidobacteria bacterium]|nr:methyltransferase domain-containing protein [Acidobacteriota bacterium]
MAQEAGNKPNPEVLQQMYFSFAPAYALSAALQLNFFSHLATGRKTAADVAQAAQVSPRGAAMLLDTLAAFQLLTKKDPHYELTPLAAEFLVRTSPNYLGHSLEHDPPWESWSGLTKVIRTGRPDRRIEQQEKAEQFFSTLVRTLHVTHHEPARRTAQVLGAGASYHGLRVVDIACGSAVWSIAIAEADQQARVTAQDFPTMLDVTRQYLKRHGVEERYDFLTGDLKQVDFGHDRFDLALVGNIVHSEGERSSRELFTKLHRALRSGGRIAIMDMIPNDERTGPPFPLVFALHMLVSTEEGGTFSLAEYRQWLTEAGFVRVETADIGSHSPLVIGFKS